MVIICSFSVHSFLIVLKKYEWMLYLVLYGEDYCVDEEKDEWRYIYEPNPEYFEDDELEAFFECRKYIQKTIIKRVERT